MAKTPEGEVKAAVKKVLNQAGAYHYWPVPAGFGKQTLDCLVLFGGRGCAIETKQPKSKPTPRQVGTMAEMVVAGVDVFVIDGVNSVGMEALKLWLSQQPN